MPTPQKSSRADRRYCRSTYVIGRKSPMCASIRRHQSSKPLAPAVTLVITGDISSKEVARRLREFLPAIEHRGFER